MSRLSSTINALIGAAPSACTIRCCPLPGVVESQTNKRLRFVIVDHFNASAVVELGIFARRRSRDVDDYRRAFGPIDVTTFLDVINVTAAASSDDTEFDYRRGIEVEDDNEAEPLIGLRLDYAW
jgi:hypothetical protein